jgi:PhnB protein
MPGLTPYILFPGTAREALTFYGDVFGGTVRLHTFAEFQRTDGPVDAVAHGYLVGGPISQVVDRYGLHWLIGFEGDESD